jgi:hypothetical protein
MYTAPHEDGPPEVDAITGHTWEVNPLACDPCHTEQQAENLVIALASEVEVRIERIEMALGDPATWEYACCGGPPDADDCAADPECDFSQDDITDDVKKARFLIKYVEGDASEGAHNSGYVRSMLAEAEMLLGIDTPLSFPYSLHTTRQGKATFWSAENGGMELIVGIPMSDLPCQGCHAPTYADGTPVDSATYEPSCRDCHADPANPGPVEDAICYGCHQRQGAEGGIGLPDVHRDAGMGCMDCHTIGDTHGNGVDWASMLEPGAIEAKCENCHTEFEPGNPAHDIHLEGVHCTACHTSSVISCYNCHMESMIDEGVKKFFGPPPRSGFKFLLNRDGKVHTASFQSATYDGQSFYVLAPYTAHSVAPEPTPCEGCHGNPAMAEYTETGEIVVTSWDEGTGTLDGPTGVIPVPPDWSDALIFDFLDYDPGTDTWSFLKTGADLTQMMYATPLTEDQMAALSLGLEPAGFPETIVEIQAVNGGAPVEPGAAYTVDFTIEDELGNPIAREDLNRLRIYVSGPTENYQVVLERDDEPTNFVQNPDGSYTYAPVDPFPTVYAPPPNDSPAFGTEDGEMTGMPLVDGTYTVLIESRQVFGSVRKAGDATLDFIVANDPGAPPALAPRQFVLRDVCNDCHNDLQIHGSNRYAVTGCVICHVSGSEDLITDPETTPGVTIKLGEMIHRLHRGHDLPTVQATSHGVDPYRYLIIGFRESVHDFSDVGFPIIPMATMDCAACHEGAAQEEEIYTSADSITRANCVSCHADLDFATGTILDQSNPDVADGLLSAGDLDDPAYRVIAGFEPHTYVDGTCTGCHNDISGIGARQAHQHPTTLEQEGTAPWLDIVAVGGMSGGGGTYFVAGDIPEVTFRVADTTADPLQLIEGDSSVLDRLEFVVGGPTTLYQTIIERQRPWNGGSLAVDPANWIDNFAVDGTYTFIFEDPIPENYPAQANALGEPPEEQIFPYEGGWGQLYTADGTPLDAGTYTVFGWGRRITPIAGEREPLFSDAFDVPLGADDPIVPYAGTVETASCNACHGNLAFHGYQREGVAACLACHTAGSQDGGTYESVDLRIMVHKLHNARNLDVVQQGGAYELNGHSGIQDFSHLLISSMPGEAAECHECHTTDAWKAPPVRANMRTWMVACTSCHDSADTRAHVDAFSDAATFEEYCDLCHAEGGLLPVDYAHASP